MAKSFLSIPINQIPTTSEAFDDDYILLESPKKGTRIILKSDLIDSLGVNAGKGLIKEDSSTIGVDFKNIAGVGLSGIDDQIVLNYGIGLSADNNGKIFVNTTALLSAGAPSSLVYYDSSGLSAIHKANSIGKVKHLYWTASGGLSAIQPNAYSVPTVNNEGGVILYNLVDATNTRQVVLNSSFGDLTILAGAGSGTGTDTAMSINGSGDITISNINSTGTFGRWNSDVTYNSMSPSITDPEYVEVDADQIKIFIPEGTYLFNEGFYSFYSTYSSAAMYVTLDVYDDSNALIEVMASSGIQDANSKQVWHTFLLKPTGIIDLTEAGIGCYMRLNIHGPTTHELRAPNSGTSDQKNAALFGSIKITQLS